MSNSKRSSMETTTEPGDFSWMNETLGRKSLWQRIKEDPLVPLGCLATTAVLLGGLASFQQGHSKLGNKFMQARVVAQLGTVLALSGGGYYATTQNTSKKEKRKLSYEERMQMEYEEESK